MFICNNNTMILYLLFICLLGGSTVLSDLPAVPTTFPKSVMCYFKGNMADSSSDLVNLEPKDIPCECEVIIYGRFEINTLSVIDVDEISLKSVTDLNKPVIVSLSRDYRYKDWAEILGPDGNAKDSQVLCDFALKNNISGFLIEYLTPGCIGVPFNHTVAQNMIPYIKQLLNCRPDFIIGVGVDAYGSVIKNPCMYNFVELNKLVTFYEIKTYELNACRPTIYNGRTPITKVDHGRNYTFGMEEVASFIKESQICPTKIVYDIEIDPTNTKSDTFSSYSQVCKGQFNSSTWCVQTTNNFFNKGKFALEQNSGIIVKILDLDDIQNDCGCGSTFFGFKNIIAGFRGCSQMSCANFDIQSPTYQVQ